MSAELIARINSYLGRVAIDRLRFVQDALADPSTPPAGQATAGPPPVIEGIRPGALHDALARLGQAVQQARRRR